MLPFNVLTCLSLVVCYWLDEYLWHIFASEFRCAPACMRVLMCAIFCLRDLFKSSSNKWVFMSVLEIAQGGTAGFWRDYSCQCVFMSPLCWKTAMKNVFLLTLVVESKCVWLNEILVVVYCDLFCPYKDFVCLFVFNFYLNFNLSFKSDFVTVAVFAPFEALCHSSHSPLLKSPQPHPDNSSHHLEWRTKRAAPTIT